MDAGWESRNLAENGQAQHLARGGDVPANSFAGLPVWGEGYQDTILFRDGQLANMKRYLAVNPRRLTVKRLFPDLFRVVGEWSVPLSLPGGVRGRGRFAAIGNRFLLDRPLAQVQVSRRDFAYAREAKPGGGLKIVRDAQGEPIAASSTPLYAEKKAALFAAARHASRQHRRAGRCGGSGGRGFMSFYSNIIQHLDLALKGKDSVALAQAARDAVQQTVDFLFAKKGVERDADNLAMFRMLKTRIKDLEPAAVAVIVRKLSCR